MVDANSLIEGHCKFRDGKKWKSRWTVITKLSPVADCLQLQIYRDEKERARNGHTKASLSLQHFLAMESGFTLDKESHTLAIICQDLCVVLAFDNRTHLIQWSVRISNNLGEGHQFLLHLASAPAKSKLSSCIGPVRLHVTDKKFCLTGGLPPRLLGSWEVSHLRRYGLVDGRFIFEGGSRCTKGEGVHVLVPEQSQITLIMDALDMSSKGQLLRMPSRRFANVTDSPRKTLGNRFSETRTILPAESSANVSVCTNMSIAMSPTPRESRSAEELCNACTDGPSGSSNSFWMSSEASSRCDLDSCENLSGVSPCQANNANTSSPAKAQQPHSQISKPLPSAMERCLSCMSKLGQGGLQLHTAKDILSPSWTMDLGGNSAPPHSQSSGNSDRLSISSHGSSGGVTEYCYDTPRSILKGDVRWNRANTPPVTHQSNFGDNPLDPLTCVCVHGCESSQRASMVNMRNGCTTTTTNGNTSMPGHGCLCHRQGCQPCGGPGPIYYCIPEQPLKPSQPGPGNESKTLINLHSHPGPYENYDFPRSSPQVVNPTSINCQSTCCNGNCCTTNNSSNIDWRKKQPMDRNSIASSASALRPSELSEWYDVPRRCPNDTQNSGCPNPGCQQIHNANVGQPCGRTTSMIGQYQKSAICHQYPSTSTRNPLENYDVPSNYTLAVSSIDSQNIHPVLNGRVNGEGKMPLATTSIPVPNPNPTAIYAQVDKSKKKPKSLHTCDISRNHTQFPHQPTYMNVTENRIPARPPLTGTGIGAKPTTQKTGASYNPNNYVNLDFADSLQIYENSKDVRNHAHTLVAEVSLPLVEQNQRCEIEEKGKLIENSKVEVETKEMETSHAVDYENISKFTSSFETKASGSTNGIQSPKFLSSDPGGLPLRRSSSVPCKGGHANRGSSSSSDSGVSGDGGLFFDDSSPLNDIGSLCLHESLPRKGQRVSPGSTSGRNISTASTPKPQKSIDAEGESGQIVVKEEMVCQNQENSVADSTVVHQNQNRLSASHYETIDEVDNIKVSSKIPESTTRPSLTLRNPRSLVSDANSTSSGASDMSDYIDTLSSCSRASLEMVSSQPFAHNSAASNSMNISASPKKSTNMKPRSGKEYFKIDRAMFTKND